MSWSWVGELAKGQVWLWRQHANPFLMKQVPVANWKLYHLAATFYLLIKKTNVCTSLKINQHCFQWFLINLSHGFSTVMKNSSAPLILPRGKGWLLRACGVASLGKGSDCSQHRTFCQGCLCSAFRLVQARRAHAKGTVVNVGDLYPSPKPRQTRGVGLASGSRRASRPDLMAGSLPCHLRRSRAGESRTQRPDLQAPFSPGAQQRAPGQPAGAALPGSAAAGRRGTARDSPVTELAAFSLPSRTAPFALLRGPRLYSEGRCGAARLAAGSPHPSPGTCPPPTRLPPTSSPQATGTPAAGDPSPLRARGFGDVRGRTGRDGTGRASPALRRARGCWFRGRRMLLPAAGRRSSQEAYKRL